MDGRVILPFPCLFPPSLARSLSLFLLLIMRKILEPPAPELCNYESGTMYLNLVPQLSRASSELGSRVLEIGIEKFIEDQ